MDTEALLRIEHKLDALLMMLGGRFPTKDSGDLVEEQEAEAFFRQFTVKQNAALQMLLRGASNEEIAQRFGVTANTAKVHVRSIAKKLGVNTRARIAVIAMDHWRKVREDAYKKFSKGLPKTWDEEFKEPDPFAHLYRSGDDEAGEEE